MQCEFCWRKADWSIQDVGVCDDKECMRKYFEKFGESFY